jgi:hypothetical protein
MSIKRTVNLRDAFVLGGIAVASTGAGFIYWPAGLILFGLSVAALGLWPPRGV